MSDATAEQSAEVKSADSLDGGDSSNPAVAASDSGSSLAAGTSFSSSQTVEHSNKEQVNPQDATIKSPEGAAAVDFDVTVHSASSEERSQQKASVSPEATQEENSNHHSKQKPNADKLFSRRRRKGKRVRVAHISEVSTRDDPKVKQGLPLPSNQYEATLIRRAVRKKVGNQGKSEEDSDVYGDTSLGMKLSLLGGKVIVQSVTALTDGRASPAQLAGMIKRGDVILSINGASLVKLSGDPLLDGLHPLSAPDATGLYRKRLDLRLEVGAGLELLNMYEADVTGEKKTGLDLGDMFSLVDQLSGIPLFEGEIVGSSPKKKERPMIETPVNESPKGGKSASSGNRVMDKEPASSNERISLALASWKQEDRSRAMSAFFAWNKKHSRLLRGDDSTISSAMSMHSADESLTKEQYLERGQRAILGATALTKHVERVDSGKDVRSFQSWKTTLSLHSQARSRRRYILDAASLPLNIGKHRKEEDDALSDNVSHDPSVGSATQEGDEENLDGDELLLRLAAHDEIWRKQVIEFLEERSANRSSKLSAMEEEPVQPEAPSPNDFGSFLFGANVSKILNKHKKTQALPPEEVTAVLFDLTTKLSASVPDEINASGINVSSRSSVVPFRATKRPAPGSPVMLATQFVVDDALPAWTKTFRPLPWDQRRVLWPLHKPTATGSSTASTLSDDLMTLDTLSTGLNSMSTKQRMHKNLREQIEEQELDPETREETCFLLTYLFTQSLLPRLIDRASNEVEAEKVKDFVMKFGAYLRLHTCVAYAASLKAEETLHLLLDLAHHDPHHRDFMRHASQAGSLMLYEPAMLSAVVQRLHMIQAESSQRMRQLTIDLCATAYPDVQPWQVRKQCFSSSSSDEDAEALVNLYYTYLSLLLHPVDGHSAARKDKDMVKDWCDLSVKTMKEQSNSQARSNEHKANFIAVASRATSSHHSYARDLVHLLGLSMDIEDFDLAISIASEILDNRSVSKDDSALSTVLDNIRAIARKSLRTANPIATRSMKRILKLFRKASQSQHKNVRDKFDVPMELVYIIRGNSCGTNMNKLNAEDLQLMEFLANEAAPQDALRALSLLTELTGHNSELMPCMQTLLRRAANESVSSEMSVALMKVKHARMDIEQDIESQPIFEDAQDVPSQTIWLNTAHGMLTIAK